MGSGEDDFAIAPDSNRRRNWLITAGVAALALLLAVTAWAVLSRGARHNTDATRPSRIEHALVTTPAATPDVTASVTATTPTGSQTPSQTVAASGTVPAGMPPGVPKRVPYLAFRLNGTIYLAREDGNRAIPLVRTAGVYALSPDARSLAFVEPATGKLVIRDLSSETTVVAGSALQVTPRWSPDSSALYAVRDAASGPGTEVFRVSRATGATASIAPGSGVALSPDGTIVAIVPSAASADQDLLRLIKSGKVWKDLKAPGPILDAALSQTTAYVATAGTGSASADGIWSLPFSGGGRLLAGVQDSDGPGTFGILQLSSDGANLTYARIGDDGRSRTYIFNLVRGTTTPVSRRRDVYALEWAANSSALFAIEGNSLQGEATALVRISSDGRSETVVAPGADR